ncbi:MAG: hypothetical protein EYC70_10170 [Planctomycetota bacterium]|nr:MAG: hypothetical protein EYC70_10170 [Planctomycetota bacterium]
MNARVVFTGCGALGAGVVGRGAVAEVLQGGRFAGAEDLPEARLSLLIHDKGTRAWTRTARLLAAAAQLAAQEAGWLAPAPPFAPQDCGVVVGSTYGNLHASVLFDLETLREGPQYVSPQDFANTVINQTAGRIAARHGFTGLNTTLCTGEASALDALDYARTVLRRGRVRAVLCGAGLERAPEAAQVCVRLRTTGVPFAEGAAAFALELEPGARARGARRLAVLAGAGSVFRDGAPGQEEAVQAALEDAGVRAAELSEVIAPASGHAARDAEEGAALERLGVRAPVLAPKAAAGECLEASAALAVALALSRLEARPPAAAPRAVLVCASDPLGHHAAVVLAEAQPALY